MQPRLNGWQRLWVVVALVWTVPVLVVSYLDWPTRGDLSDAEIINRSTFVSETEVRSQLSPAENAVLKDPEDLLVAKLGGTPGMKIVRDLNDPGWGLPRAVSSTDATDWFAAHAPVPVNSESATPKSGDDVTALMKGPWIHAASITRMIVTRTLVRERQARMVGVALAGWALPMALLYALGWSVGWVRRGFPATT